jgi:hypothetical protein
MLPDFLWIALMLGRRSDWRAVYRPLDIVEQFRFGRSAIRRWAPDDLRVGPGGEAR